MVTLAGSAEMVMCMVDAHLHYNTYTCDHWALERRELRRDGREDYFKGDRNA